MPEIAQADSHISASNPRYNLLRNPGYETKFRASSHVMASHFLVAPLCLKKKKKKSIQVCYAAGIILGLRLIFPQLAAADEN